jgi:uracil-DNA glycosylase
MSHAHNAQQPMDFVTAEIRNGKTVYPSNDNIFSALELTPIEDVKVVILGQDPYHGEFHHPCVIFTRS